MPLKFKVYPGHWLDEKSPYYWTVFVFDCHDYMYKAYRRRPRGTGPLNFGGIVMPCETRLYSSGRLTGKTPHLGDVLLVKSRCQIGVLAHESVHMAEGFAKRTRVKLDSEAFAYAVGMCTLTLHGHLKKWARLPWKKVGEQSKFMVR